MADRAHFAALEIEADAIRKRPAEIEAQLENAYLLLSECARAITQAIACEDGLDGGDGMELLRKIEATVPPKTFALGQAWATRVSGEDGPDMYDATPKQGEGNG